MIYVRKRDDNCLYMKIMIVNIQYPGEAFFVNCCLNTQICSMASETWYTARITGIFDETENTKRFYFRVPGLPVFHFKPGQFVTFDLPIHEKKNRRWRSYSIASAPNGSNEFELVISYNPQGLGTNYLWKKTQVGSSVTFKGPAGVFTLPEKLDIDICFVATGTGIAPFRSMLLDLINHPRAIKNMDLVFGTRYLKDVLYRSELEKFPTEIPGFHFHLTLSREKFSGNSLRHGYVHPVYEELFADKRPALFYLCGWREMIDEAKQRILAMGYDRKAIHVELYG